MPTLQKQVLLPCSAMNKDVAPISELLVPVYQTT